MLLLLLYSVTSSLIHEIVRHCKTKIHLYDFQTILIYFIKQEYTWTNMETADLQSSQYLDSIVEEPLHGYDGSNKGDPNGQASCEQIAKSNTFHSLKA